jgi:ribA/ribD-fused uncharacterized protein
MANNRMNLVNTATGQRVLLATHLATQWRSPGGIECALDRAFEDELDKFLAARGSTAWRVEYEQDEPELDAELRRTADPINHGQDTDECVRFYERDFYVLSNFSAFRLRWRGHDFDTSEAAYQWSKFHAVQQAAICVAIRTAPSAHEAFKIAEHHAQQRRADWELVRVDLMRDILRAKVDQHEYVRRKLLATGDRQLIEDSWRDPFWGWGPDRSGKNMLGVLWMEIRAELKNGKQ